MRLKNKICIITGAAQGIGAATVAKFAAEGAIVIGCDRRAGLRGHPILASDEASDINGAVIEVSGGMTV